MSKDIIKVEDYKKEKHDEDIIIKVSKHTLEIKFDEYFDIESDYSKKLNVFVMKPKQAYYNNDHLYCPYINYFMKFYDTDNELLLAYLKLKVMIDRGGTSKYNKEVFLDDLFDLILSDSMIEKIKSMVKDNYSLELTSKKKQYKYKAIEFSDLQGVILLNISMAIKILLPIVSHYAYVAGMKNKKTDKFLGETFYRVLHYFQEENNLYNKLYEFILSKVNKFKHTDKRHWEKVEILGSDIATETEKILMRLLVDLFYKYNFEGNIISYNSVSTKNIVNWSFKENFEKNFKVLSDNRDESGLTDFDKIEMNMSKFDESNVVLGKLNIKQTIKKLRKIYNVTLTSNDLNYYVENVGVNKLQKDLVFNLFGKYFGNVDDLSSINLKQYSKLVIIMKKMLDMQGFDFMQHILTGNMRTNPYLKKMPKKLVKKIEDSPRYIDLQDKYSSAFDIISSDNGLLNNINTILGSNVTLVDYKNRDKHGKEINIKGNVDIIIDEYLKLIMMV